MPTPYLLFKMMKACIGVEKKSELWIYCEDYEESSINTSIYSDDEAIDNEQILM